MRNAALSPTTTTYTAATAATLVLLDERISLSSSSLSSSLLLWLLGRRVRKGGNECANQSIEPEVNFVGWIEASRCPQGGGASWPPKTRFLTASLEDLHNNVSRLLSFQFEYIVPTILHNSMIFIQHCPFILYLQLFGGIPFSPKGFKGIYFCTWGICEGRFILDHFTLTLAKKGQCIFSSIALTL